MQTQIGTIRQGYIERSNVNVSDELVCLQVAKRRVAGVRQALATYGIFVGR